MIEAEAGLRRVELQARFVLVEVASNKPRHMKHTEAKATLEIAPEEGMEEVVGEDGQQPEVENSTRVMLIAMIGMPVIYSLVETLVFDCPSRMPKINHRACGSAVP